MLLCLGLGSLYNHSKKPALDYRIDMTELVSSPSLSPIKLNDYTTLRFG